MGLGARLVSQPFLASDLGLSLFSLSQKGRSAHASTGGNTLVFAWWTTPENSNSSVDLWIHDLRPEIIDVSRQILFCCPNRISSTTLCGYDDVRFTVFQSSSENSARTQRLGSGGNHNESTMCETVAPCISCDIFVAPSWHSLLYERTLRHDRLIRAARELQTLSPKL